MKTFSQSIFFKSRYFRTSFHFSYLQSICAIISKLVQMNRIFEKQRMIPTLIFKNLCQKRRDHSSGKSKILGQKCFKTRMKACLIARFLYLGSCVELVKTDINLKMHSILDECSLTPRRIYISKQLMSWNSCSSKDLDQERYR